MMDDRNRKIYLNISGFPVVTTLDTLAREATPWKLHPSQLIDTVTTESIPLYFDADLQVFTYILRRLRSNLMLTWQDDKVELQFVRQQLKSWGLSHWFPNATCER